ncbi:MAG: hypothetical protein LBR79_02855 [Oscillospiraceae bacterium]|jgi:hypothetical protein|nr:hypothetical protein [Oscillospiraceae bacterium]
MGENIANSLAKCLIFCRSLPRRWRGETVLRNLLFSSAAAISYSDIFVFSPAGCEPNYSCCDLKQSSKVNLSVYSLPADGWEKVIKIRLFSNETAIVEIPSFPPRQRRGKNYYQLIWITT